MRLKLITIYCLSLIISADTTYGQLFSKSTIEVGGSVKNIVADLNGDGLNDIIGRITYLNNGTGGFIAWDSLGIGGYWSGNDVQDLDNDGDLDYLFCASGVVKVFFNDGTGHFALDSIYDVSPGYVYDGRAADLDNDGFVDIVVPGHGYSYPSNILWNMGNGKFLIQDVPPYGTGTGIDVGDFDNDGDNDLLWSNNLGHTFIGVNNLNRVFSNGWSFGYGNTSGSPYSTFNNLNADGWLDAIVLIHVPNDLSTTFISGRDSTFTQLGSAYTGSIYRAPDVDNDGDDDVQPNFLNDGTGVLTSSSDSWTLWMGLGHLNNDGNLDMAYSDGFVYYSNLPSFNNAVPSIPIGLSSMATDSSVSFSWFECSDDITPSSSIKYNLRIGTTMGGNELLSGVTPPYSPNVGYNKTWTLYQDMTQYREIYWSVQSQDGSYLRSDWSVEQIARYDIVVDSTSLSFVADQNGPLPVASSFNFSISSGTSTFHSWTVTDNVPWLSVLPDSGSGVGPLSNAITVAVDSTNLPVGIDTAIVTISSSNVSNSPQTLPVYYTVNQPCTSTPFITCPLAITIDCNMLPDTNVTGIAIATDGLDPNPSITYSDSVIAGLCSGNSTIIRTWTATNSCGNFTSCNQIITLQDTTSPVIVCPANDTVACLAAVKFGMPPVTDNCDPSPIVSVVSTDTLANTVSRAWVATDNCGNISDTCVQTIMFNSSPPLPVLSRSSLFPFGDSLAFIPKAGDTSTLIEFRVKYQESFNSPPELGYPRMLLDLDGNGLANDTLPMSQSFVSGNFVVGVDYSTFTTIPVVGTSQIAFEAKSVCGTLVRFPAIGWLVGPSIVDDTDLYIHADDINYSTFPANPLLNQPVVISVRAHNTAPDTLFAVGIDLYIEDVLVRSFVENIPPRDALSNPGYVDVSFDTVFTTSAFVQLKAIVDPANNVTELNEQNNVAQRALTVGSFTSPTGIVIIASGLGSYYPGSWISVSGSSWYEEGGVNVHTVKGAPVQYSLTTPGAAVNTAYVNDFGNFNFLFRAPSDTGLYMMYLVVTDFTLKDSITVQFQVVPSISADLVIDFRVSGGPLTSCASSELLVDNIYVRNVGAAPADSSRAILTNQGVELLNVIVPPLAPLDSFLLSAMPVVVSQSVVGEYQLRAIADIDNQVPEIVEYNNYKYHNYLVSCCAPDLVVDYISLSGTPYSGVPVSVYVRICNKGGLPASGFDLFVTDNGPGGLFVIDSALNLSLPAFGTCQTLQLGPYVFSDLGLHQIRAVVDSSKLIAECIENNNTLTRSINVTALTLKPDLKMEVNRIELSSLNPDSGQVVCMIKADVLNVGEVTAYNVPVQFSFDNQFLTNFVIDSIPNYGANNFRSAIPLDSSLCRSVDSCASPVHIYEVCIDPSDIIAELDTSNNCATKSVIFCNAADLFVKNIIFNPACVSTGDSLNAIITVGNADSTSIANSALLSVYYRDSQLGTNVLIDTMTITNILPLGEQISVLPWQLQLDSTLITAEVTNSIPFDYDLSNNIQTIRLNPCDSGIWFKDADGDTLGSPDSVKCGCGQPPGYVANSNDCNDADSTVGAALTWYEDTDGDGFGVPGTTIIQCLQPPGFALDSTDNCPLVFNPSQADADSNGVGDACQYSGPVWYVDTAGNDTTGDGSLLSQFKTIQRGIEAASVGDTVLVADGTYFERISFLGKPILVTSQYVIDPDTNHILNTIIDSDSSVVPILNDTGSVVRFVNGEDSNSVLTGFTIRNGLGTANDSLGGSCLSPPIGRTLGGGIYCHTSSPVISHCIIENCSADHGGGIATWRYQSMAPDTVRIRDCEIRMSGAGGAVWNRFGNVNLDRCWIHDNGTGVVGSRGSLSFDNCTINAGDGISAECSQVYIRNNCVIDDVFLYQSNLWAWDSKFGSVGNLGLPSQVNLTRCEITGMVRVHDVGPHQLDSCRLGSFDVYGEGLIYLNWCIIEEDSYPTSGEAYLNHCTVLGSILGQGAHVDSSIISVDMLPALSGFEGRLSLSCVVLDLPDTTDWYVLTGSNFDTSNVIFADPQFCDVNSGDYTLRDCSPALPRNNLCNALIGAFDSGCPGTRTINVPADFAMIQDAIDASCDGDTVLVADGLYYERISFKGKAITVASMFLIDGILSHIDSTVIDGNSDSLGISDTMSVVRFVDGEDSTSILMGLTIQNGIGVFQGYRKGGGIYCISSSPIVTHCVIRGNEAAFGGGVYCDSSSMRLTDCSFGGNSSVVQGIDGGNGGALAFEHSTITISKCTFESNNAERSGACVSGTDSWFLIDSCRLDGGLASNGGGGAIQAFACTLFVTNSSLTNSTSYGIGGGAVRLFSCVASFVDCEISRNHTERGGGIFAFSGFLSLNRCLLAYNDVISNGFDQGGAVYLMNVDSAEFVNCTFAFNIAPSGGSDVYCENSSPIFTNSIMSYGGGPSSGSIEGDPTSMPQLSCCNVYGNVGVDYSGIIAGQLGVRNNISVDPLFCNKSQGDYHLYDVSPCVPTKNSCVVLIGALDIGCVAGETPVGIGVTVPIVDSSITIIVTLDTVTSAGTTSVVVSSTGEPPKTGFQLVPLTPDTYYDLTTSAKHDGSITICFEYEDSWIQGDASNLKLMHFLSGWNDVTDTSKLDTANNIICGRVDSLSPFALMEPWCCLDSTGNVDNDPNDVTDIADLTFLIDHLFITFPPLVCPAEGNIDGDDKGNVDISDLTFLIDHLFINFPPTKACQ